MIIKKQKIINLLDNTPNQSSKFKTKLRSSWIEISDESFKTSMSRSRLCDYSDAYILEKLTITVGQATAEAPNNVEKGNI